MSYGKQTHSVLEWNMSLREPRRRSNNGNVAVSIRGSVSSRAMIQRPSDVEGSQILYVQSQHLCVRLRTVDNHGNTETVIYVKCRECRDFAKMTCFCRVFWQNAVVLCFHKNILFLISIIWCLLREFNTKIFTFPLPLRPKSVCFVT